MQYASGWGPPPNESLGSCVFLQMERMGLPKGKKGTGLVRKAMERNPPRGASCSLGDSNPQPTHYDIGYRARQLERGREAKTGRVRLETTGLPDVTKNFLSLPSSLHFSGSFGIRASSGYGRIVTLQTRTYSSGMTGRRRPGMEGGADRRTFLSSLSRIVP